MADQITAATGVEVALVRGGRGIFEVSVGGTVVARKTLDGFPTDEDCLEAVKKALG